MDESFAGMRKHQQEEWDSLQESMDKNAIKKQALRTKNYQ